MKIINQNKITTKISGTEHYTFNFPDEGDRIILLHTPFNPNDVNAIMVLNAQLQQMGHLSRIADFNKIIGDLIDWKPYVALVISVSYEPSEIYIEIDSSGLGKNLWHNSQQNNFMYLEN